MTAAAARYSLALALLRRRARPAAAAEAGDPRIRASVYAADEVYRLRGYVGYPDRSRVRAR